MAYGNWDDIINVYQVYIAHFIDGNTRHMLYKNHIEGMLQLIPHIQALIDIEYIPITSLTTLCLEVPQCQTEVCVWCEGNQQYRIYLSTDDVQGYFDVPLVHFDDAVATIEKYLLQLINTCN